MIRWRVIYMTRTRPEQRKQADFADFNEAMLFYAGQGPERATMWEFEKPENAAGQCNVAPPRRLDITPEK